MTDIVTAVKQELRTSLSERSADALKRACELLQKKETENMSCIAQSSNMHNELYLLCCEVAMDLGEWGWAERCLKTFTGKRAPTKAMDARVMYCDGLVDLHNIPSTYRGREKVTAHLRCATKIITGIKIILEEWPREAYTLASGIEHLWLAIRDLFHPGTYESVMDVVIFVLTLHEKLMLGGPFSQLQWVTRYAMCLRGVGRYQEAAAQLSAASEVVSKVGSERLQLQLFRLQIALGASLTSGRPMQDYTRPVLQALYAVQSFFCGMTDANISKAELIAAHERLISDPEKKEVKVKGKKAVDIELTFSDPALVLDVLSEVVLGLALCGADDACGESLPRLLQSERVRSRLFGEFAQAVLRARACGALDAFSATDGSYLTRNMAETLFKCIRSVEIAMDNARMIDDGSERLYTLQVGCVILWNISLPLLQPETRGKLRHTLKRITFLLSRYGSNLMGLLVRAAYELSLVEFEEDNLNFAIEQLDRTLSLDYFSVNADGSIVFPMDFQLLWLKRRAVVRKAIDSTALSSPEDQAIHCIEQAKTCVSTSNRLVLLRTALEKLPPLGYVLDSNTLLEEKPTPPRERGKGSRPKKQHHVTESLDEQQQQQEQQPRVITNPIAANIYYLLLQVAKEVQSSSVYPIIEKVATSLTNIDVLDEKDSRDLLLMKAEAHLSLAEVLAKEEKSSADATFTSTIDAMMHISAAAKISIKLFLAGYSEEWIVVNACLSLINWYAKFFQKGLFLPAIVALGELYNALNQTHVDPIREYKLFDDIGFGYVMSILQEYIASKGEVDGELSCESLAETMKKTFMYPICEANNPMLRQAGDVCRDLMNKWKLPSYRKKFCMLDVCIYRLLERSPEEPHHPQEQLLFLLGRLNGPISDAERQTLLNKSCLDLLRIDPSVELCGRLAVHSMQIPENERITLEICRIADQLYHDGKLGWGTKSPITAHTGKEKGQTFNPTVLPASGSAAGAFPKPTEEDWFWYSEILLHQATILLRLGGCIERSRRIELDKRVLVAIGNSAIAASHGPVSTRLLQIMDAYQAFCSASNSLSDDSSRQLLLPTLRILLSPSLLSKLSPLCSGSGGDNEGTMEREGVYKMLTTMARIFFTVLTAEGAYDEGIKVMNNLYSVLPSKYHRGFRVFEAQFCSSLGLSTTQLVQKVKGGDPETEAAVWIAIAKNAMIISEGKNAWMRALKVLVCKPLLKAETLIQMCEWMAVRNAISRHEFTTLLLSALDSVERFDWLVMQQSVREGTQNTLSRGMLQSMSFSLTHRTFNASNAACSSSERGGTRCLGELPSFREVMIAIRIMYLLFVVAPEDSPDGNTFASSKRSCVSTILHYVYCLWYIVSVRVRMLSSDVENVSKVKPLELPEHFHGWQGFRADLQHVQAIRVLCVNDAPHNTENFWGMLFDVCEFLMEDHWEQFVFMILSWIEFSINWRYGPSDPRAVAAVRAIYYKSYSAAVRSGWGSLSSMYRVEKPTAEYWSDIQELLLSADVPSPASFLQDRLLNFGSFGGTTCYCVLIEAEELFALGRLQECLEWGRRLLSCASRLGKKDVIVRCRLLEARVRLLKGDGSRVAEDLCELGERFGGLTFCLWTELNLVRFEALISCQRLEEAINLARELPQALSLRAAGIVGDGVAKEVAHDISRICYRRVLRECAQRLTPFLQFSFYRFSWPGDSEDTTRKYLEEVVDQLLEFNDWQSRCVAFQVKQSLRPFVDELLLDADVKKGRLLLELLYTEYRDVVKLTELIREEMTVTVPVSMYTKNIALYPSLAMAFEKVLVMLARNCLEREMLKRFILLLYKQLTMDELGIPTGGPKELEPTVLRYMRDPSLYERMQETVTLEFDQKQKLQSLINENRLEEGEVVSALAHFDIPLEYVEGACSADAEAMLLRSVNSDGGCSPVRLEALTYAFYAEFHRRLTDLSQTGKATTATVVEPSDAEKVRLRENDTLMKKWSLPSRLLKQTTSFKASRRVLAPERHRSKKSLRLVEEVTTSPHQQQDEERDTVNLWTKEGDTLQSVIMLGITQAYRLMDYKQLAKCYVYLAHTLMLSDLPCAAGTAVEFAQAAEMCSFIADIQGALLQSSPECTLVRLVERMKVATPFLLNTHVFDDVRSALITTSSMFKRFELIGEWPAKPNTPSPLSPDLCSFTVVREGCTSYFLVALRCPDGEVHSRRVQLDINSLLEYDDELETLKQLRKSEITTKNSTDNNNTSSEGKCVSVVQSFLQRLQHLTSSLWTELSEVLTWQAPTCHMFLCLDPIFHSLPLEQLPVFTQFLSVQRELSVLHIRQKISLRGGKPSCGGTIFVVDPFGEHEASLQSLFGPGNRIKAPSSEIITHVRDKNGTMCKSSMSFLRRALTSIHHSALLINFCGSFIDLVSLKTLMELNLDHLHIALISEGTNDGSLRREGKKRKGKTPLNLFYEKRSIVSLLLLARGVQYFAINVVLPLSPEESDAVCKRCLPIVTSGGGKYLFDAVRSGTSEADQSFASAFLFYGVPPAGKQK